MVDLKSQAAPPVTQIALGPKPQLTAERRGEMLFFDATICFQHWQSCGSCHPDARVDGLNWDLPNDGLGNPKNTRNLLHVFHGGPAMSLGVRESAAAAVRAGVTHILFAVRPEEDALALDAYIKSLQPVPSPYLVDGKLSPAAEHGKQLFFSPALNCAECHPGPYYCDKKSHSVGSLGKYDKPTDQFNTPRLTEVWRTAPYMHDGHYLTIPELFSKGQHGLHGDRKPKLWRRISRIWPNLSIRCEWLSPTISPLVLRTVGYFWLESWKRPSCLGRVNPVRGSRKGISRKGAKRENRDGTTGDGKSLGYSSFLSSFLRLAAFLAFA